MSYSDCIVLKLCVIFLQVITMAKQATMLFDFHKMAFKNFWQEVANKTPSSTLNMSVVVFRATWHTLIRSRAKPKSSFP